MNQSNERNFAGAVFVQQPAHMEIDYSEARRVFAFGDVHGNIDPLRKALEEVEYDAKSGDRMVGLGDWLDRGDHTLEVADFIEEHKDDLVFVKGNHEQMLEDSVRLRENGIDGINLIKNGGAWIFDFFPDALDDDNDEEERDDQGNLILDQHGRRLVAAVCGAPVALTIKTPGGYKIGVVHAEVRRVMGRLDWDVFTGILEEQGTGGFIAEEAMWERDEIRRIRVDHACEEEVPESDYVENIDHVFHGHTILKQPLVWGNRSWIDVASYKRGEAAFINIDEWTSKQNRNPTQRG